MDDNFIYDDLVSHGDLGNIIHDLEKRKNELELHVASLEKDIKKLCDKITEMKAIQDNLSRNISELYNTAKNELNRKDRRIAELQAQLDDMVFRRNPIQSHLGFKRKREEPNWEESNKKSRNESVEVVPVKSVSDNYSDLDINSGINKSHNEDKRMVERVNLESNSFDSSRHESDRSGKTYSRENSYKIGRNAQKEDSHKSMIERVNTDHNSHESSKYECDRSGKTSHSRENTSKRDRRDEYKDKRDNHRDKHIHIESRIDNRDNRVSRRDQREPNREHRNFNNRGFRDIKQAYRDRSRDCRNSKRDYGDSHQGGKDYRREHKDTRPEDTKRTSYEHRNEVNESKNLRCDKIDDFNYIRDEQMDLDPRREPVFSAAESTKSPSESFSYKVDTCSREEGEVSDEEICDGPDRKDLNRGVQGTRGKGMEIQNIYCKDEKRLENVSEKSKMCSEGNLKKYKESNKKSSRICTKDDSSKTDDSIHKNDKVCTKENLIKDKESKDEKRKASTKENPKKNENSNEEDVKCNTENNNANVNIISQVILHEGMQDATAGSSKTMPEEQNKSQENKNKPPIIATKLDKPKRESRVPRNLTDELNINLERSDKKQKLMHQLFGSSEKKGSPKHFDQFSPAHSVGLSHEGEIPNLNFLSSPDSRGMNLNHASTITNTSNPVTEFQIFKTNLPSLEKSNSLPSIGVQIQTPDNSTPSKDKKENSMAKSIPAFVDYVQESAKQNKNSEELVSTECPVSTRPATDNVPQSSSDVCNVSLDLLNMDIGQYKAEDFPNLIAHSELKDMSDLLLTPVDSTVKSVSKTRNIMGHSTKNLSDEIKIELNNSNQSTKPTDQKEFSEQPVNLCVSDKKEVKETKKSVHNENVSNVPKKSSNISNKDKKLNVTNKNENSTDKIVLNKNSSESPKPIPTKRKSNKKEIEKNSNKKTVNQVIADEKISDNPSDLKNGDGPEQKICETNLITESTDAKETHNEVKNAAKECANTSRSRKQNKTNINKKTTDESVPESSEKPVNTSNKKMNVNTEPPEIALISSKETKSSNKSDRRRKRCGVKWV